MFMDEGFSISDMEEAMEEEDEGEVPYNRLKHIYLKSDCGLCNQPMDPDQWTLALIGNPTGTRPVKCTKKFQYPRTRETVRVRGILPLCQRNECRRCTKSPPSVTIHATCYRVFMKEYQQESAMERIWIASCWKFPWLHDPVQLTPRLSLDDTTKASVRASTARAFGIPELATLPPVVLQMIKSFVPHHPPKCCRNIKSWQRGQPVVCDKDDLKKFVLRLTVDRDGLKQIEKLESWPEYSQVRSNAFAYLFVVPIRATKAHVDFKCGRAFLKKDLGFGYGEFWDTPTPPEKGLSMFATPFIRSGAIRFRTVDLCNITGLTFFYFRGYIMGVHAHTADSPTAQSTFGEISAIDPKYLMWAYVPISSKDRLMRIGVRDTLTVYVPPTFLKPTVLISTKLAGDFALGPHYGYTEEEFLSGKEPTVFVYNVPHKRGHGIYGAVSDKEGDEPLAPFPRLSPNEECPPYRGRIHFEAPAKGIVHVDVYYNEVNGYCRGLLLEYANGAQRALGQCRVGVDPFKAYEKSTWICYRDIRDPKTYRHTGSCIVECTTGTDSHEHGSNGLDDWVCMPTTKGYLQFGCDHKIASLDIYTLRSEEEEDE